MALADKIFAALLLLTSGFTTYYWIDYFTSGGVRVVEADWYLKFEAAFPVADAWMAVTSLAAAVALLKAHPTARPFSLLASSALIFLGLIDTTFNVQNGLYALIPQSPAMTLELVINAYTLGLGGALAAYFLPTQKKQYIEKYELSNKSSDSSKLDAH